MTLRAKEANQFRPYEEKLEEYEVDTLIEECIASIQIPLNLKDLEKPSLAITKSLVVDVKPSLTIGDISFDIFETTNQSFEDVYCRVLYLHQMGPKEHHERISNNPLKMSVFNEGQRAGASKYLSPPRVKFKRHNDPLRLSTVNGGRRVRNRKVRKYLLHR